MNYGDSGPPDRPPHRKRDKHIFPIEQANSIPPYHPSSLGSSNPRPPFPSAPQFPPPFPSPQYGRDPAPFAMQWGVSSPNPPSSNASGFPSPGDFGSFPSSPSQFPVPSTDHVPLSSIYHPPVIPEPHITQLPSSSGPYAPVLPTRIQSFSSFIQPTIRMPEPQPSTAPPYPPYQQKMWDPRNTPYQHEEPFQSENRAREWDSTGYNAPARPPEVDPLGSRVPSFRVPNEQAPLNDVVRSEPHRDRPNHYRPPASAREQPRKQNHRPPLNQPTQPYNPEGAHPIKHRPVPLGERRDQGQLFPSASSSPPIHAEQRQHERLRPSPSQHSPPAHRLDRRQSQSLRPPLSPHSVGSDAPPSYTSSPQMSTASSPRPFTASPPSRPLTDFARPADIDALSARLQHGMNFRLHPPPPGRASGSRLSGTTTMSEASSSSAPNVDRSRRRPKHEPSRDEKYRPDMVYGGMKKALLIGINYTGNLHQLNGCINDVLRTRQFLIEHGGYRESDIVLLTDDSPEPRRHPTRENIIKYMEELVESAEEHDTLFLQYSGHGGQIPDQDGDEDEGMDSTIKPSDYEENDDIVDDKLHEILVKPLPEGCRLTALVDSCHSGTILDLPYMYCFNPDTRSIELNVSNKGLYKASNSDVILFAGCMDTETGEDTTENGLDVGAMNWAFIETLLQNPNQTYHELFKSISKTIRRKYNQTPVMSASHKIDLNARFVC